MIGGVDDGGHRVFVVIVVVVVSIVGIVEGIVEWIIGRVGIGESVRRLLLFWVRL